MDLLDVAARLFRERGVGGGASIRAIAEAAGLHLGSVTYRYRTKDALLAALMERALARATTAVRDALDGAAAPIDRLRSALRAHAAALIEGDAVLALLFVDWRRFSPRVRQHLATPRREYEALWDGVFYAAIESGAARPGLEPRLLRELVVGAANAVALGANEPRDATELAEALVSLAAPVGND